MCIKACGSVSVVKKAAWCTSVFKTRGSVSVAKKAAWRTSVLFMRIPVSTFLAFRSLKTIGTISTKFIYVVQ